jgi:hypothetical protein
MKKLALSLAGAGAFVAVTLGLATPAIAAADYVAPGHDAVYSTQTHTTTAVTPVDCHVHVNYGGSDVDVAWC